MRLRAESGSVRATDATGHTVTVEFHPQNYSSLDRTFCGVRDGTVSGMEPSVADTLASVVEGPDEPDGTVAVETRQVTLPPAYAGVVDLDSGGRRDFHGRSDALSLDAGRYLLRIASQLRLFVRFDGSARIERSGGDSMTLSFPERTRVSVGFEDAARVPDERVTVPPTPRGVARAIETLGATSDTTSPERTWPTLRDHPPLVTFGEEYGIPSSVADDRPDVDVTLVVPPERSYPLTAASLVAYLGASVEVDEDAAPRLVVGDAVERLPAQPSFQWRVARLLRRVFTLDCLVRGVGPHADPVASADLLDDIGIDPTAAYDRSMTERVRRYLAAPVETVRDRLPEWHLSVSLPTNDEAVTLLPRLTEALPYVFTVESGPTTRETRTPYVRSDDGWTAVGDEGVPVTGDEGTSAVRDEDATTGRSDGRFRGGTGPSAGSVVATTGPPRHGDHGPEDLDAHPKATHHGWFGDGVPVGTFRGVPAAFENRDRYVDDVARSLSIVTVFNDDGTGHSKFGLGGSDSGDPEHERAVRQYRRRASALDLDVTLEEGLSVAELGRTFEDGADLVHFVGHHDERGLRCADGYLSSGSVGRSNARTFFLNACGSYEFGVDLIEKGSVAGGVTLPSVADGMATAVGVAFARLVVDGFAVAEALDVARQRVLAADDYAVVGDGTHVVTQAEAIAPSQVTASRVGDDAFAVAAKQTPPWITGTQFGSVLDDPDEGPHLIGRERTYEVSRSEFAEFLDAREAPLTFEDELVWPEDLRERLLEER
jgi:hypothetical protein